MSIAAQCVTRSTGRGIVPAMTNKTPRPALMQLADARLGKAVEQWIAEQRADGLSWQAISFELHRLANMPVSPSTLLRWSTWHDDNGGSSSRRRRSA